PAGSFRAVETSCAATTASGGAAVCTIRVEATPTPRALPDPVGGGVLLGAMPPREPVPSTIDEPAILAALAKLPLRGNEEGVIQAFGLYATWHYANYYNYISYEFERRLTAHLAELQDAAREVLVEAGHVCAFNTFGGIMESPEWAALIEPMCRSRADWVS